MSVKSVQFAVATHIMAALGFHYGTPLESRILAESVRADPTFVRKAISKLAKARLIVATRGKNGACSLGRPPGEITLAEVYIASESPVAFTIHSYPIEPACPTSSKIKECLQDVQRETQRSVEASLSKITLAEVVADVRRRVLQRDMPGNGALKSMKSRKTKTDTKGRRRSAC